MIETTGLAVFNKAIAGTFARAVCTISGKDYNLPIHSISVNGSTFQVNIYLDDTINGQVTNTKLYNNENVFLIQRPDRVDKPSEKNLLIVFNLELKEVSP